MTEIVTEEPNSHKIGDYTIKELRKNLPVSYLLTLIANPDNLEKRIVNKGKDPNELLKRHDLDELRHIYDSKVFNTRELRRRIIRELESRCFQSAEISGEFDVYNEKDHLDHIVDTIYNNKNIINTAFEIQKKLDSREGKSRNPKNAEIFKAIRDYKSLRKKVCLKDTAKGIHINMSIMTYQPRIAHPVIRQEREKVWDRVAEKVSRSIVDAEINGLSIPDTVRMDVRDLVGLMYIFHYGMRNTLYSHPSPKGNIPDPMTTVMGTLVAHNDIDITFVEKDCETKRRRVEYGFKNRYEKEGGVNMVGTFCTPRNHIVQDMDNRPSFTGYEGVSLIMMDVWSALDYYFGPHSHLRIATGKGYKGMDRDENISSEDIKRGEKYQRRIEKFLNPS